MTTFVTAPILPLPPSAQQPVHNLAPRDLVRMAAELKLYHAEFAPLFTRREQRRWSEFYLQGQLSDLERKTVEPMVLQLQEAEVAKVRAVQQFLGEGRWNDDLILQRREELVAEDLGEADAVLILDGSGFPKKGEYSAGVARQYCGAVGKVSNCQHGVFLVYLSSRGYTFVDRRLYVPREWFGEEYKEKRKRCRMPEKLKFKTELVLGVEMLRGVQEREVLPFQWVVADSRYGMNPKFIDQVAALNKWYLLEVPNTTSIYFEPVEILEAGNQAGSGRGRGRNGRRVGGEQSPQAVKQMGASLPAAAWVTMKVKDGSQGVNEAEFAFLRGWTKRHTRRPGSPVWIIFRRTPGNREDLKYYQSNAPEDASEEVLARVVGLRWPVETALEEAKSELGMDHYETRSWSGWHHQMTLTFLAHHFLVRMRLRMKKNGRDDASASENVGIRSLEAEEHHGARSDQNH